MIWNIVTDSSCELRELDAQAGDAEIRYTSVPFIISVENKDYVDDDQINVDEMLNAMENSRQASHTSCPSPHVWEEAFRQEGHVIAITISKELSGSYNSACVAMNTVLDEEPGKRILVINSASAGPGMIGLIRVLMEDIAAGYSFDEIAARIDKVVEKTQTIFALSSFDNLVKNGRMSKLSGFIARTLGFWGIGEATPEGRISIIGKERVTKKVLAAFQAHMQAHGGPAHHVIISHCQNSEMAQRVKEMVRSTWPDVAVECYDTRALDSYYAERHGLIIGYC